MALPFLPGNSFDPNVSNSCSWSRCVDESVPLQVGKTQFHKSHAFDFSGPVPVFVGEDKPGIGGFRPGLMVHTINFTCLSLYQEENYYQDNPPRRRAVCSLREWGETSLPGLPLTDRSAPPSLYHTHTQQQ